MYVRVLMPSFHKNLLEYTKHMFDLRINHATSPGKWHLDGDAVAAFVS